MPDSRLGLSESRIGGSEVWIPLALHPTYVRNSFLRGVLAPLAPLPPACKCCKIYSDLYLWRFVLGSRSRCGSIESYPD